MICYNCKGNGYVKIRFECEEAITQCKVCNSSGETKNDEFYHQSWNDSAGAPSLYYGRHLTYKEMKDLKTTKFMPSKVKQFKGEPPF